MGGGGAVLQGEVVLEGAQAFFLLPGDDAVAHRMGDALPEALLQGLFDILAGGMEAVDDGLDGLPGAASLKL